MAPDKQYYSDVDGSANLHVDNPRLYESEGILKRI